MLAHLRQLVRYRGLVQSLVARELRARYRGSVLGFFWSFINPLLLLVIYTFVFTVVFGGLATISVVLACWRAFPEARNMPPLGKA